jgi:hypothetical protein
MQPTITVVHLGTRPNCIRVDRKTALGNPFVMETEEDRDRVCREYESWLKSAIAVRVPAVVDALNAIYRAARKGPVELGCWCAPRRCHADTIKALIEAKFANPSPPCNSTSP